MARRKDPTPEAVINLFLNVLVEACAADKIGISQKTWGKLSDAITSVILDGEIYRADS